MKSMFLRMGLFSLLISLAAAGQEARPPGENLPVNENEAAAPRSQRHTPTSPEVLVEKLSRLQRLMHLELALSPEQRQAVDERFARQIEATQSQIGEGDAPRSRDENADQIRELQSKLVEAQKDGDRERLQEVRKQLRAVWKAQGLRAAPNVGRFIMQLTDLLDGRQADRFRELVRAVGLDEGETIGIYNLRRLYRAVLEPDLGLTREQKRAVQEAIRDYVAALRAQVPSQEAAPGALNENGKAATFDPDAAYRALRERILESLTPEQRAKVEAVLAPPAAEDSGASAVQSEGAAPTAEP